MAKLSVPLDDYSYMSQSDNANEVSGPGVKPQLPPADSDEQPWTDQQVELFKTWIDDGCPP